MEAVLGIDVAKDKLDVMLLCDGRRRFRTFDNIPSGWRQILKWLTEQRLTRVHACLEATGRYGDGIACCLHEAGHVVSIVNPAQIKDFARSKLGRNKTDKVDAALAAEFCLLLKPPAWTPPPKAVRSLRDLVRTSEALHATLTEYRNRKAAGSACAAASRAMSQVIARVKAEIEELDRVIIEHLAADPHLKRSHELLVSIPGIGTTTAAIILAELPDIRIFRGARQVAAYAGLTPRHHLSGTSVHTPARLCRVGNGALRRALYFPTLSAMRFNSLVRALSDRLEAQGRLKPKQIVAAAMRKLLHLCYGVLKTGKPFDSAHPAAPVM
jgi:transposase